ncbi:sigma-70 family RNA polymerase sigma factor [Pseudoflavonifractor sp. 524-17]|uniref:RNA polymerase sigma factor n=1 Tax=Pseudoflavonifractor sp. 524-17 TaxID=2304577 RepID=UPI00137AD519|nr:sigma-70 family RNA polymerase sigma factor [Pseudoflavonifractor sp. 524-17]NCE66338.1 sigma-70 family RNA polymerase sigma factor [Pseudoflavonifractor sp. 524-17]
MMLTILLALLPEEHKRLFLEFHRRYESRLYVVALNILKNPTQAEDALSEAMLKIIGHFEDFLKIYENSCEKIGPWAVTIVKNTALDLHKKERRNEALDTDWDNPAREDTESQAAYRYLVAAIRTMPETYRRVLELKLVAEWSAKEIAQATGLSETAVNNRISRGRTLLQQKLYAEGYEYERR